jgi:hypothetical protein
VVVVTARGRQHGREGDDTVNRQMSTAQQTTPKPPPSTYPWRPPLSGSTAARQAEAAIAAAVNEAVAKEMLRCVEVVKRLMYVPFTRALMREHDRELTDAWNEALRVAVEAILATDGPA